MSVNPHASSSIEANLSLTSIVFDYDKSKSDSSSRCGLVQS